MVTSVLRRTVRGSANVWICSDMMAMSIICVINGANCRLMNRRLVYLFCCLPTGSSAYKYGAISSEILEGNCAPRKAMTALLSLDRRYLHVRVVVLRVIYGLGASRQVPAVLVA